MIGRCCALFMVFFLSGCVANPYGAGIAFGVPSFSSLFRAQSKEVDARVSSSYITLSNEEIYHSKNNIGKIFIDFKAEAFSKETKIYMVYSSPSKSSKIIIAADVLFLDSGKMELPIPDYPSKHKRYKEYRLEYVDIYMSGTHNLIYFDRTSEYFNSGRACYSDEGIDKTLHTFQNGNEVVATIYFNVEFHDVKSQYTCDFRPDGKYYIYGKNPDLDLGL